MVELSDGTRKLLSEVTGAEAAAGVCQRTGLSGGEAVVHIQRFSYGLPVNDRSGGASKGLL